MEAGRDRQDSQALFTAETWWPSDQAVVGLGQVGHLLAPILLAASLVLARATTGGPGRGTLERGGSQGHGCPQGLAPWRQSWRLSVRLGRTS